MGSRVDAVVTFAILHILNFAEFVNYSSHKFKFENAYACVVFKNLDRLVVECHYYKKLATIFKHYYVFDLKFEVRNLLVILVVAKSLIFHQLLHRSKLKLVLKMKTF